MYFCYILYYFVVNRLDAFFLKDVTLHKIPGE